MTLDSERKGACSTRHSPRRAMPGLPAAIAKAGDGRFVPRCGPSCAPSRRLPPFLPRKRSPACPTSRKAIPSSLAVTSAQWPRAVQLLRRLRVTAAPHVAPLRAVGGAAPVRSCEGTDLPIWAAASRLPARLPRQLQPWRSPTLRAGARSGQGEPCRARPAPSSTWWSTSPSAPLRPSPAAAGLLARHGAASLALALGEAPGRSANSASRATSPTGRAFARTRARHRRAATSASTSARRGRFPAMATMSGSIRTCAWGAAAAPPCVPRAR